MDVLTFETYWAVNSEIIKQVTSSWPIFIQLQRSVNRCTLVEVLYEIFVNIGCNKKLYVLQRLTIFRTCKQQHSIGCNYTQRVIGCKLNVICDLNYSRERISAKSVFCSEKFNFFFKLCPETSTHCAQIRIANDSLLSIFEMLTVVGIIKIGPFLNPTVRYCGTCGYRGEEESLCVSWNWHRLIW